VITYFKLNDKESFKRFCKFYRPEFRPITYRTDNGLLVFYILSILQNGFIFTEPITIYQFCKFSCNRALVSDCHRYIEYLINIIMYIYNTSVVIVS